MKKILEYRGKIKRKEFIFTFLGSLFVYLIISAVFETFNTFLIENTNTIVLVIIYFAMLILVLACMYILIVSLIKRLRDIGLSPFFVLLIFVPIVNILLVAMLMLLQSKQFIKE